ncbi:MAG: nucleotidyltransferase family protein [Spirochaetaceae bacterium]|nr:MAG: nucleotidyltransferase family protein [Spirochaetaceae bacterium]
MHVQSALIPAAGLSSRMGSSKPLLKWGDTTLVERAVGAAFELCVHVIVVVGHEADQVNAVLRASFPDALPIHDVALSGTETSAQPGQTAHTRQLSVVRNLEYRNGMLSSLRCGAAQVSSEWFYIAPVDMPLLTADVYRAVQPHPDADAVFPVWNGRRGHPVLVRSTVLPALFGAGPEIVAMRDLLTEFRCRETPAPSEAVLIDVDTAAEYKRLSPETR